MSDQSIINKFRPISFDEFLGNENSIKSLKAALQSESRPHVYLFTGPPGTGKTSAARIVARMIDASITEMDGGADGGVEGARKLVEASVFKPLSGKPNHMYIIDEFGSVTKNASAALLKLLEEPPEFLYFSLCTSEPDKVTPAIKSRSHPVQLKSLKAREIEELIATVSEIEKWEINNDVFNAIVVASEGSARKALTILQAGHACVSRDELSSIIAEVEKDESPAIDIARFLLKGGRSWKAISKNLEKIEDDEEALHVISRYLASALVRSDESQAHDTWLLLQKFTSESMWDKKVQLCSAIGRILWGTIPF